MGVFQTIFTDPFVAIALSSTAVYLFIVLAIRLFGKRELAQLSVVGLRKSGISEDELLEAVREHGVASIREVDLAVLEVDGNISVLSADYRTRTVRRRRGRGRKKDGSN